MTTNTNNSKQNQEQMDEKVIAKAIAPLTKRMAQLETTNTELNNTIEQLKSSNDQLGEKIILLEASQTENLNELKASYTEFLKQLADSLNSKKSGSNLEPLLQKLAEVVQENTFEIREQRESQEQLSDRVQQVLTAQQVMEVLNSKAEIPNNEPPDNS